MKKIKRRNFLSSMLASAGFSVVVTAPSSSIARVHNATQKKIKASKSFPYAQGEHLMTRTELECDVLVAGGGLSGICAALSAARHGSKVVLIQDRSRLGGNSSSEIKMHPLGVNPLNTGWREGGIIEELKLENAANNPQLSWEMWDFLLYDKCVSEKNITLLLDTTVCAVEKNGNKISKAFARCDTSRQIYEISAKIFIDTTGDCRLAMEADAEVMSGREGSKKYGESLADFDPIGTRQGSTLLFTSKLCDSPVPFKAPPWARKITPEQMKYRGIKGDGLASGYWWIELGGDCDAIAENEKLRFELLAIVLGVWDYIKNSGKFPEAAHRALDTISMVPGRRDSYRIVGERIMTQHDIMGKWKDFDDAVAVGGWSMDDHPAKGFNAPDRRPCRQYAKIPFYNIGFSSMYSKDVENLMMAGRNISCSHVAFTSTRVMSTCSAMGQAVGTAAAICVKKNITPSELRNNKTELKQLQQTLLRDDQTIIGIKNEDPLDLARSAIATSSISTNGSSPTNALSGINFDSLKSIANSWIAPISAKPSIQLSWKNSTKISSVQLTFFSGNKALSQSLSDYLLKHMHRGAQKELPRDFNLVAILENGAEVEIAKIRDNFQRLVRVNFKTVLAKALRVDFLATNGDKNVILNEIRAYA